MTTATLENGTVETVENENVESLDNDSLQELIAAELANDGPDETETPEKYDPQWEVPENSATIEILAECGEVENGKFIPKRDVKHVTELMRQRGYFVDKNVSGDDTLKAVRSSVQAAIRVQELDVMSRILKANGIAIPESSTEKATAKRDSKRTDENGNPLFKKGDTIDRPVSVHEACKRLLTSKLKEKGKTWKEFKRNQLSVVFRPYGKRGRTTDNTAASATLQSLHDDMGLQIVTEL